MCYISRVYHVHYIFMKTTSATKTLWMHIHLYYTISGDIFIIINKYMTFLYIYMYVCICKKQTTIISTLLKTATRFYCSLNKCIYTLIYKSLKNSWCLTIVNLETSISQVYWTSQASKILRFVQMHVNETQIKSSINNKTTSRGIRHWNETCWRLFKFNTSSNQTQTV